MGTEHEVVRAHGYLTPRRLHDGHTTTSNVSDFVMGSKGICDVFAHKTVDLKGKPMWKFKGKNNNMYHTEHEELFASIRNNQPINNGEYMAKSTLLAIMGRMAAYTGKTITWDKAMDSKEDLTPARYDWKLEMQMPRVAHPGVTEFS